MQVSVEKTSELSRKMTVTLPEEMVQEKISQRLNSMAKHAKVDGFRPGKVPHHVIKKMFGASVRQDVAGDLIESTYPEALQSENLRPASSPYIDLLEETDGFKYTAVFEVYPEVSLENMNQVEVAKPVSEVTQADVDDMIDKLRRQKMTWTEVERASQTNDRLTINFAGVTEGENFTNGTVENYSVEIGAGQMIPGFEDNLVGLVAGAEKIFEITFPEEYGNQNLAGKLAEFTVTVSRVEEPVLPEINAEFIESYASVAESIEEFRQEIQANMERELQRALKEKTKNAVVDALCDKIQFAIPTAFIDSEVERLMKPYVDMAKKQKLKLEDLDITRANFEDEARQRIAASLILGKIIEEQKIEVNPDLVRAAVEDLATSYESPSEVVNYYYADKKRLADVENMVLENQVIDWVLGQVKVTDQAVSFKDAMDKQ